LVFITAVINVYNLDSKASLFWSNQYLCQELITGFVQLRFIRQIIVNLTACKTGSMKNLFFFFALMPLIGGNFQKKAPHFKPFDSIVVDTILSSKISIRALLIDKNRIWYAGDKSRFGYYDTETKKHTESRFKIDTLEFRAIAKTDKNIFVLNAGSPAYLYRMDTETKNGQVVYEENSKKTFYDSMQFWNSKEGIAMGDPTDDCLSILVTRDGGTTWKKLPCAVLPKVETGEAAFAASNTNIIVKGSKTWIVSGGKKARVFYSGDKGKKWRVYDTPIVQGKAMTGIFSADFYDSKIGFVAGGDYEKQRENSGNKALTTDGGKTWKLIGENKGPGYISCIQFVPHGAGKALVTVGATGLHFSQDSGATWKELSKDDSLYTIRFQDDSTAYAAGRNKIVRIRFKK
jgi:photosystem II stability/assembly factor-like uncharacterized protein